MTKAPNENKIPLTATITVKNRLGRSGGHHRSCGVLGFVVLDRYQQGGPALDLWSAICRGLGITSDTGPAAEPQPPLRTPTRIAWTSATLNQIAAGNTGHLSPSIAVLATATEAPANRGSIPRLPAWTRRSSSSNLTIFVPESGRGAP
jgi:hypothetical protein